MEASSAAPCTAAAGGGGGVLLAARDHALCCALTGTTYASHAPADGGTGRYAARDCRAPWQEPRRCAGQVCLRRCHAGQGQRQLSLWHQTGSRPLVPPRGGEHPPVLTAIAPGGAEPHRPARPAAFPPCSWAVQRGTSCLPKSTKEAHLRCGELAAAVTLFPRGHECTHTHTHTHTHASMPAGPTWMPPAGACQTRTSPPSAAWALSTGASCVGSAGLPAGWSGPLVCRKGGPVLRRMGCHLLYRRRAADAAACSPTPACAGCWTAPGSARPRAPTEPWKNSGTQSTRSAPAPCDRANSCHRGSSSTWRRPRQQQRQGLRPARRDAAALPALPF